MDLSEVYRAAAVAVAADKGRVNTTDRDRVLGECVVDAAVVPILEALRARAQAETQRHYDPEDDVDVLVSVEEWLSDLIEEVREHGDR